MDLDQTSRPPQLHRPGVVVDPSLPRSQWRKRAKQRHALLLNCAQGLQRIGESAAAGDPQAYGAMLRVLELTADAMAPAKGGEKGYGARPLMSRIVSDDTDAPAPPAPGPTEREPAVIDKNGVPYVEAD